MDLYNEDCFNVFPKLKDKSIDLFVLDLPYGQTACKWDSCIDLTKMWVQIKRIMKPNAVILFYCTTKFGYKIIQSNEKWFRYDLIWKKSRKVGFLSANKMPLRQHENIYVFKEKGGTYNPQKTKGKKYKCKQGKQTDLYGIEDKDNVTTINKGDRHPTSIIEHENVYVFKDKGGTYNPQKTKGHKERIRSHNKNANCNIIYGDDVKIQPKDTDTTRHPTSIIEHENVYIFSDDTHENKTDLDNSRNKELRDYAEKVKKYIGKSLKQINKDMENRHAEHFFYIKSTQFGIPTEETYNKLIEIYKINEMEGFIDYKTLKSKWEKHPPKPETTYNPQKTEGKPYKPNRKTETNVYGTIKLTSDENKGDRHPTSIYPDTIETTILEHNNPKKSLHRTQKPTSLCEWLIKTYSNEEDTVMDFTMGSGTTGQACKNTKRKFIGVEMDKDIFKIAKDRLDKK